MTDSFYPFIGEPEDYVLPAEPELPLFYELAWDFKKDDFLIDEEKNEIIIWNGEKALEVWIYKALKTNQFEHVIYSWDYGTSLITLVGQKFSRGLTESEAFRYVKESLLKNRYITDVINNGVTFVNDEVTINVIVETVYGEVKINVRR